MKASLESSNGKCATCDRGYKGCVCELCVYCLKVVLWWGGMWLSAKLKKWTSIEGYAIATSIREGIEYASGAAEAVYWVGLWHEWTRLRKLAIIFAHFKPARSWWFQLIGVGRTDKRHHCRRCRFCICGLFVRNEFWVTSDKPTWLSYRGTWSCAKHKYMGWQRKEVVL